MKLFFEYPSSSQYDLWKIGIHQVYLQPLNIARGTPFSWSQSTATAILNKNANKYMSTAAGKSLI